jgi:hypothetical protein
MNSKEQTMWNLEGQYVQARYLDTYTVVGKVELSRVAFGGRVHHTLVLDKPINLFGTERDRVIVEHQTVERIASRAESFEV